MKRDKIGRVIERDITGEIFNFWTGVSRHPKKPRYWYFKCRCGKIKLLQKNSVVFGKSKSCGCYRLKKGVMASGDRSGLWKGNLAGYTAIHEWVRRWKKAEKKCQFCGTTNSKKYEWANIDHKYKRVLNDYVYLCCSCHKKYDYKKFGFPKKKLGKS